MFASYLASLSLVTHLCSEALAFSLVTGINNAMARLVDIWDSMGIMEEQRVERMETVKKHIEVRLQKTGNIDELKMKRKPCQVTH